MGGVVTVGFVSKAVPSKADGVLCTPYGMCRVLVLIQDMVYLQQHMHDISCYIHPVFSFL